MNRTIPFLVIFLSFIACRQEPQVVTRISKEDFTLNEQRQIGRVLKETIENNYERFPRLSRTGFAEAYNYLDLLLETLLISPNVVHRKDYDWDVTIVRNDMTRTAFITPGGHFYIYTGLLKFLESEHQLAGVISHEIAYADSDFIVNRLKSEYGGVVLGDILLGNEVAQLDEIARSLETLTFSEPDVLNADSYSVDLLCPFAYDAKGVKSILEAVDTTGVTLEWLEIRRGDLNERIQNIEVHAAPCGAEGQLFIERYKDFKENLLP